MSNFSTNNTPIFREDGRAVGKVVNGVLIKHVRKSKHMLKRPQGWACDITCLEQAIQAGAHTVRIVDDESHFEYITNIYAFQEHGIPLNRKYGKQICLPLKYWIVKIPGHGLPIQTSLFEDNYANH